MPTKKEIAKHIKDGGFFIGSQIVKAFTVDEDANLVGVLFFNDSSETYTQGQWDLIKAKNVYPDGEISERRYQTLLKDIRIILLENLDEQDKAIRGILELMVKERCDLNSHQFVLQLLAGSIQSVIQGVTNNVNDSIDQVLCNVFNVVTPKNILLAQAHELLVEETEESEQEQV